MSKGLLIIREIGHFGFSPSIAVALVVAPLFSKGFASRSTDWSTKSNASVANSETQRRRYPNWKTEALHKATLGLNLTLLSAFLHYALGMTTRNICAWLRTFCQFQVAPGGSALNWQRLAEIFIPVYEGLGKAARFSALLNADESGWRIAGRTAWIRCFTNATLAYYVLTPSCAAQVVKKVLGSLFKGILITDFFGA
jgi:hypothetical protein